MFLKRLAILGIDLCLILIVLSVAKNLVIVSSSSDFQAPPDRDPKTPFSQISPIPLVSPLATPSETVTKFSQSHPLLNLINSERQSRNIPPLTLDLELSNLAEKHSQDMADRSFFSHLNPDGKNPFQRLTESGIVFQTAGENIAFAPNLETAHQNLMKSEEHRNNILNPDFEKIGIGDYTQNPNKILFTEVFTN